MKLDAFSFGGGVQSTAALVLAAQGKIDCNLFIFANVGEDSEHPDTLEYVKNISRTFAEAHGIEFVEIRRNQSIREKIFADNRRMIIPVFMPNGAPGNRGCTVEWKIRKICSYLRRRGFSIKTPAVTGIGFSLDEYHRMKTDKPKSVQKLAYPLIDMRITRQECRRIIEDAGLPVPPKSSCFFCPFHSPAFWARMRNERPDLYDDAIKIEKRINEKRGLLGKDKVYLHRYLVPLDVIGDQMMLNLDDDDSYECASGVCFV